MSSDGMRFPEDEFVRDTAKLFDNKIRLLRETYQILALDTTSEQQHAAGVHLDRSCISVSIVASFVTITALIERATDVRAFAVGKPSPMMMRVARMEMGLIAEAIAPQPGRKPLSVGRFGSRLMVINNSRLSKPVGCRVRLFEGKGPILSVSWPRWDALQWSIFPQNSTSRSPVSISSCRMPHDCPSCSTAPPPGRP